MEWLSLENDFTLAAKWVHLLDNRMILRVGAGGNNGLFSKWVHWMETHEKQWILTPAWHNTIKSIPGHYSYTYVIQNNKGSGK